MQQVVQGQCLCAKEGADEAVWVGEVAGLEQSAIGYNHAPDEVNWEFLKIWQSGNGPLKVSLRWEGNPEGELELGSQIGIYLEEWRVEVDKVVTVEVVGQAAGPRNKALQLSCKFGAEVCRRYLFGASPKVVLVEEKAILIYQAWDCLLRQDGPPGRKHQVQAHAQAGAGQGLFKLTPD